MVLRKSYFDNIFIKFGLLNTYEFTNNDIIDMTVKNPYILAYSNDKLINNIDNLFINTIISAITDNLIKHSIIYITISFIIIFINLIIYFIKKYKLKKELKQEI